jgi:hypothetical protein
VGVTAGRHLLSLAVPTRVDILAQSRILREERRLGLLQGPLECSPDWRTGRMLTGASPAQ